MPCNCGGSTQQSAGRKKLAAPAPRRVAGNGPSRDVRRGGSGWPSTWNGPSRATTPSQTKT